jgi:hypothetical protein
MQSLADRNRAISWIGKLFGQWMTGVAPRRARLGALPGNLHISHAKANQSYEKHVETRVESSIRRYKQCFGREQQVFDGRLLNLSQNYANSYMQSVMYSVLRRLHKNPKYLASLGGRHFSKICPLQI